MLAVTSCAVLPLAALISYLAQPEVQIWTPRWGLCKSKAEAGPATEQTALCSGYNMQPKMGCKLLSLHHQ